jgi:Flp pilus assembly protein CpaB
LVHPRPKRLSEKAQGAVVLKRRGVVVVLALVPVALLTAGVVLYSRGVDGRPPYGEPMVPVVVSKVDIPCGADLTEWIKDDQFRIIRIQREAVIVDHPVTSIDQLRDWHNSLGIFAGEQIRADAIKRLNEWLGMVGAKGEPRTHCPPQGDPDLPR